MKEVFTELKEKNLLNENGLVVLENYFSSVSLDLFKKQRLADKGHYSETLKSFALTLNFYSPKAYSYVRDALKFCLPHPSTLRTWYSTVDGSPGFTEEAFNAIKHQASSASVPLSCALIFDEMALKQVVEWDG